ncbi:MAG: tRNA (adenosine(37)-N6)-threonylcarbamoyltransferase complex ATPase subunit type 1 TsaE [Caulobacterales bacterium]
MILPADGDFRLDHESDTQRLGAAIAGALQRHEAVCLSGPLGAGKTTLARSLVRSFAHTDEDVPSPTFTLVQFYETGVFPLAHFDLYRLAKPEEALELGLDEALDHGAVVIEWAEKLQHHLPADRLDVELRLDGETRRARLTPHGAWQERPLEF